jgi:hypothetical protein
VEDAENLYGLAADAVRDEKRRALNNQFPGSSPAARTSDLRKSGQSLDRRHDNSNLR